MQPQSQQPLQPQQPQQPGQPDLQLQEIANRVEGVMGDANTSSVMGLFHKVFLTQFGQLDPSTGQLIAPPIAPLLTLFTETAVQLAHQQKKAHSKQKISEQKTKDSCSPSTDQDRHRQAWFDFLPIGWEEQEVGVAAERLAQSIEHYVYPKMNFIQASYYDYDQNSIVEATLTPKQILALTLSAIFGYPFSPQQFQGLVTTLIRTIFDPLGIKDRCNAGVRDAFAGIFNGIIPKTTATPVDPNSAPSKLNAETDYYYIVEDLATELNCMVDDFFAEQVTISLQDQQLIMRLGTQQLSLPVTVKMLTTINDLILSGNLATQLPEQWQNFITASTQQIIQDLLVPWAQNRFLQPSWVQENDELIDKITQALVRLITTHVQQVNPLFQETLNAWTQLKSGPYAAMLDLYTRPNGYITWLDTLDVSPETDLKPFVLNVLRNCVAVITDYELNTLPKPLNQQGLNNILSLLHLLNLNARLNILRLASVLKTPARTSYAQFLYKFNMVLCSTLNVGEIVANDPDDKHPVLQAIFLLNHVDSKTFQRLINLCANNIHDQLTAAMQDNNPSQQLLLLLYERLNGLPLDPILAPGLLSELFALAQTAATAATPAVTDPAQQLVSSFDPQLQPALTFFSRPDSAYQTLRQLPIDQFIQHFKQMNLSLDQIIQIALQSIWQNLDPIKPELTIFLIHNLLDWFQQRLGYHFLTDTLLSDQLTVDHQLIIFMFSIRDSRSGALTLIDYWSTTSLDPIKTLISRHKPAAAIRLDQLLKQLIDSKIRQGAYTTLAAFQTLLNLISHLSGSFPFEQFHTLLTTYKLFDPPLTNLANNPQDIQSDQPSQPAQLAPSDPDLYFASTLVSWVTQLSRARFKTIFCYFADIINHHWSNPNYQQLFTQILEYSIANIVPAGTMPIWLLNLSKELLTRDKVRVHPICLGNILISLYSEKENKNPLKITPPTQELATTARSEHQNRQLQRSVGQLLRLLQHLIRFALVADYHDILSRLFLEHGIDLERYPDPDNKYSSLLVTLLVESIFCSTTVADKTTKCASAIFSPRHITLLGQILTWLQTSERYSPELLAQLSRLDQQPVNLFCFFCALLKREDKLDLVTHTLRAVQTAVQNSLDPDGFIKRGFYTYYFLQHLLFTNMINTTADNSTPSTPSTPTDHGSTYLGQTCLMWAIVTGQSELVNAIISMHQQIKKLELVPFLYLFEHLIDAINNSDSDHDSDNNHVAAKMVYRTILNNLLKIDAVILANTYFPLHQAKQVTREELTAALKPFKQQNYARLNSYLLPLINCSNHQHLLYLLAATMTTEHSELLARILTTLAEVMAARPNDPNLNTLLNAIFSQDIGVFYADKIVVNNCFWLFCHLFDTHPTIDLFFNLPLEQLRFAGLLNILAWAWYDDLYLFNHLTQHSKCAPQLAYYYDYINQLFPLAENDDNGSRKRRDDFELRPSVSLKPLAFIIHDPSCLDKTMALKNLLTYAVAYLLQLTQQQNPKNQILAFLNELAQLNPSFCQAIFTDWLRHSDQANCLLLLTNLLPDITPLPTVVLFLKTVLFDELNNDQKRWFNYIQQNIEQSCDENNQHKLLIGKLLTLPIDRLQELDSQNLSADQLRAAVLSDGATHAPVAMAGMAAAAANPDPAVTPAPQEADTLAEQNQVEESEAEDAINEMMHLRR